jgi:hypothetical protein
MVRHRVSVLRYGSVVPGLSPGSLRRRSAGETPRLTSRLVGRGAEQHVVVCTRVQCPRRRGVEGRNALAQIVSLHKTWRPGGNSVPRSGHATLASCAMIGHPSDRGAHAVRSEDSTSGRRRPGVRAGPLRRRHRARGNAPRGVRPLPHRQRRHHEHRPVGPARRRRRLHPRRRGPHLLGAHDPRAAPVGTPRRQARPVPGGGGGRGVRSRPSHRRRRPDDASSTTTTGRRP